MKKLAIIIAGLVLLLILGLVMAYLFRTTLLHSAGPFIAENYGLDIAELDIGPINLQQIIVPSFKASYFDQGSRVDVSIKNLMIQIDPWAGMQGSIKDVRIDTLTLVLDTTGQVANEADSNQSVIEVIKLIPAATFSIDQVELSYVADSGDIARFIGRVIRQPDIVQLNGELVIPNLPTANLDMLLKHDGQFEFQVKTPEVENNVFKLMGNALLEDEWLLFDGNGDVLVSTIDEYAGVLGFNLPVNLYRLQSQFNGKLEVDLSLNLEDAVQSLAAEIDLDTSVRLGAEQFELQQVDFETRTECITEIVRSLECKFRHPIHGRFEFVRMPTWLREYVKWQATDFVAEINPASELAMHIDLQNNLEIKLLGDMRAHAYAQSAPFSANALLSNIEILSDDQSMRGGSAFNLEFDVGDLISPIDASRVVVTGQGKLSVDEVNAQVQINKGARLIAQQLGYQDIEAKKIELSQLNSVDLFYENKSGELQGNNIQFSVLPVYVQRQDTKLRSSQANLQLQLLKHVNNQWVIQGEAKINQIDVTHEQLATTLAGTQMKFDLRNDQLNMHGNSGIGEQQSLITFELQQELDHNSGSINAALDSFQIAQSATVKNLVAGTGLPMQFKAGLVDMAVIASWKEDTLDYPDISLDLTLHDVAGDYAQNQFMGLNTNVKLHGSRDWRLQESMQVDVAAVNVGVPITNINFGFGQIEKSADAKPIVKLNELSAKVLDGSIYAENIDIDLNRTTNDFSIYLFNLSLEKLLALNQTKDLIASGSFDGELPIRIESDKFSVREGWIKADENGGVIKYDRIEEVLVGNPNLELVADLLKDFRYNEMSAKVDLQPDGKALLVTKLHGRSPNSELNKQVNLNFNIEFNLWKFLESARLLTRIDQDITEQILSKQRDE